MTRVDLNAQHVDTTRIDRDFVIYDSFIHCMY